MDTQEQKWFIQNLDTKAKKAHRRGLCLVPGCTKKSIRSHVISEKMLKLIADDQGKVLTWLPQIKKSGHDIYKSLAVGKTWEQFQYDPEFVPISGNDFKVTEPLFCKEHDDKIFKPIEGKEEISLEGDPEQVLLLAYRVLCSATFSALAVNKVTDQDINIPQEAFQRKQRFQAEEDKLQIFQLYEQMRITHQYDQLECLVYSVDMQPCIASTYSFIALDNNDIAAISAGERPLPVEDGINFSFLPHKPSNKSVCVISFLRKSQNAPKFLSLNKINPCSKEEQKDFFLFLAFGSPTSLYFSPAWWQSLSYEKQEEYKQLSLINRKRHMDIFWPPDLT